MIHSPLFMREASPFPLAVQVPSSAIGISVEADASGRMTDALTGRVLPSARECHGAQLPDHTTCRITVSIIYQVHGYCA